MNHLFQNRSHAGRLLGQRLEQYANRDDVIILALPRGPCALWVNPFGGVNAVRHVSQG